MSIVKPLPLTSDTLALWQLQGDLNDIGPNFMDPMRSVGSNVGTTIPLPAVYTVTPDSGGRLQGFDFNFNGVVVPTVRCLIHTKTPTAGTDPRLMFTGEFTWQVISYQRTYFGGGPFYHYIDCRFGNVLYGVPVQPILNLHGILYQDSIVGITIPGTPDPPGIPDDYNTVTNLWTFRRRALGGGAFRFEVFKNDILWAGFTDTTTGTALGTELLTIGGSFGTPDMDGIICSLRVFDGARATTDIVRDYIYVTEGSAFPPYALGGTGGEFVPTELRDPVILRGKAGLAMQTGWKERAPEGSNNIYNIKNIRAAAQAATVYRQSPKMFPMPDDER